MKPIKWKTEKRRVNDLVPHPDNPRILTKKQEKDLRASLATCSDHGSSVNRRAPRTHRRTQEGCTGPGRRARRRDRTRFRRRMPGPNGP